MILCIKHHSAAHEAQILFLVAKQGMWRSWKYILICVHSSHKECRHNLKACMSNMPVCSAFKSFSFLSAHTASYLYPVLSISFPLPLFCGLLYDRAIVCVWGCVDKREPVSTWEAALWLTVGGCRLQGLSLWLFCSGSAHFLGRVSTWAPSLCAFYFLSRGSRPSSWSSARGRGMGRKGYQLWG